MTGKSKRSNDTEIKTDNASSYLYFQLTGRNNLNKNKNLYTKSLMNTEHLWFLQGLTLSLRLMWHCLAQAQSWSLAKSNLQQQARVATSYVDRADTDQSYCMARNYGGELILADWQFWRQFAIISVSRTSWCDVIIIA